MATQASGAQVAYIRDLLRDRDTDGLTDHQKWWLEGVDFTQLSGGRGGGASRVIDALLKLPLRSEEAKAKDQGGPAGVPNGRYAVEDPTDGVLKFYKVNSPTDGRWAGFTFLDVQASDELHAIRDREKKRIILEVIAADVQGAMLRYGREIGSCGHCGRTLTNEESRAYGIGPICRGKMGW